MSPAPTALLLGATGLVGSAAAPVLTESGFRVVGSSTADADLREIAEARRMIETVRPDVIVHAAGRVGGIAANVAGGLTLGLHNALVTSHVLAAALDAGVEQLVYLGCACCYPNDRTEPMTPDDLFDGPLEATSRAYALAKSLGIELTLQARASGLAWVAAVPSNLYGPHDDFDLAHTHVVPALLRRLHEAKTSGAPALELWGSGRAVRQFLHATDLGHALAVICRDLAGMDAVVNVGGGNPCPISELVRTAAGVVGYTGEIAWSSTGPDGTPVKVLDDAPLRAAGWRPRFDLAGGIADTYSWLLGALASGSVRGWSGGN